jgi:hypothetical protein
MNKQNMAIAIENYIIALDEKYGNAIPVFGGALFVYDDIDTLIRTLPTVIKHAKFFEWHENSANTCRTFCHCAFIDPALIEAYIGMTFENFVTRIGV